MGFLEDDDNLMFDPYGDDGSLFARALNQELRDLTEVEELDWWSAQCPYGRDEYNGIRFDE